MAKSKVGGTRAYIRGRIGSDVYSVGKNGKGQRQQVVRSLAEQVSNPRTSSQMFGRMVMSTVMQVVSALKPIIDHSFDGIPTGQPSISEFIRQNYALVKADAAAHPASGNFFGLVKYQEKGAKAGKYIISTGNAVLPTAITGDDSAMIIALTASTLTVGGLKAALGLTAEGYLTYVLLSNNKGAQFVRINLSTDLSDETAITAENVGSLFTISGNAAATAELNSNSILISITEPGTSAFFGFIVSDKVDGVWTHNTVTLNGADGVDFASDVALPTYPTGSEQFLNGGDL